MAFASTDRMDGVAGGYSRPSVRGTASRGAAEGFDRILSAASARAPQAARTGDTDRNTTDHRSDGRRADRGGPDRRHAGPHRRADG